jgi:uncharacterized membrane protein
MSLFPRSIHAISLFAGLASVAFASSFTFTALDAPGANGVTSAYGINDAGQIVGYSGCSSNFSGSCGFLWSGGMFSTISDPSGFVTEATGINDAGEIVGSASVGGFLDNGGTFTAITSPSFPSVEPRGINIAGEIVGTNNGSGSGSSFLDDGGTFTAINDPLANGLTTQAFGINDAGQIVGSYRDSSGVFHGFLDVGGTFTTITDPLATTFTVAYGINDAGAIVGYYDGGPLGFPQGFLDTGGTFTNITVPGAERSFAYGINNVGQIVGEYVDADGNHGFLATPTSSPEPSTLAMGCAALLGLIGYRTRKWLWRSQAAR